MGKPHRTHEGRREAGHEPQSTVLEDERDSSRISEEVLSLQDLF